jgi:pimeloyl-ACP methyl ester carboxylesterase
VPQRYPITKGWVPFRGYRTWYRLVGERLGSERLPVLLLHGGPGIPSDCLTPLTALADTGRPVVFDDQLGSGSSDRVRLLGFSWGGTLALEYALTQPSSLASLTLHAPSVVEDAPAGCAGALDDGRTGAIQHAVPARADRAEPRRRCAGAPHDAPGRVNQKALP